MFCMIHLLVRCISVFELKYDVANTAHRNVFSIHVAHDRPVVELEDTAGSLALL